MSIEAKLDDVLRDLGEVKESFARIDERTERMDTEIDRRFDSAHARITEVRNDARGTSRKSGGVTGAVSGTIASIVTAIATSLIPK